MRRSIAIIILGLVAIAVPLSVLQLYVMAFDISYSELLVMCAYIAAYAITGSAIAWAWRHLFGDDQR